MNFELAEHSAALCKGEFVGGCDIVRKMYQSGKLQKLLQDKGVTVGK